MARLRPAAQVLAWAAAWLLVLALGVAGGAVLALVALPLALSSPAAPALALTPPVAVLASCAVTWRILRSASDEGKMVR